ncbi:MAG: major capsid family protein [Myxococcota bacterium]
MQYPQFEDVINTLHRHSYNEFGVRMDDAQVAMLEQQLEQMKTRIYEVRFQEIKGRVFVPFNEETDRGAHSIAWEVLDSVGKAEIISGGDSDDIPLVETVARKESKLVYDIATGYRHTITDLWASAFAGKPLNDRRGRVARRAIELKIDDIVFNGIPQTDVQGLVNHDDVDDTTPDNGNWDDAARTYEEIAQDVALMVRETIEATGDVFRPDTLGLPTNRFVHLATKPVGSSGDGRTVLAALRDNLRELGVTRIESSNRLEGAGAGGTHRAVLYLRDPEVLEFDLPLGFFQMPPERRGLGFITPVLSRCAGLTIHHPKAIRYMDGI